MTKLGYCGDDCELCPRYIATQSGDIEAMRKTAQIWEKAGWREDIIPSEEITCQGCTPLSPCRYKINECATGNGVENCGRCGAYPCDKIMRVFELSEISDRHCKEVLSKSDYEQIRKAFFSKKTNLDRESKENAHR